MRGEFQIGQFSTLGDRLDDFRREKRQPDEAGNVAISYALAAGDRGQRGRPAGNEFLEPRWARAIALSSAASGLRGGASAPSIMSRISAPRRFIRIAKNCVIGSIAAAPWARSTGNGRWIESSMPPGFRFGAGSRRCRPGWKATRRARRERMPALPLRLPFLESRILEMMPHRLRSSLSSLTLRSSMHFPAFNR